MNIIHHIMLEVRIVMKSKLKKYRLLARLTQTEVAEAVGVSQPTYQRWESGTNSVPKTKAAKLAKILGITQRQVEGQPEPFDLLNVDASVSDERKYFGEVSIHFASGSPPLLLPITQAERLNLYAALQGEASFIQIESLDNRIVSVRRKAIADVFFSEEAYDDYGPEEDYGSQHLGIFPDERFWQIIEQLEEPEFLDGEFDKNEINEAMKKLLFDDSELDELIANGSIKPEERSAVKKAAEETAELYLARARDITWQIPGLCSRCISVYESRDLYEAFYDLQWSGEQEMVRLASEEYYYEIFLNTSAIDYIAAPAHKFHEGELQSAAEEMGEEE